MHIVKLLQTWLMETEGNIAVITCLGQGDLPSQSALSSYSLAHNASRGDLNPIVQVRKVPRLMASGGVVGKSELALYYLNVFL